MNNFANVEKIVGYSFKNKKLLENAFVHSSYANETGKESNERLEFLGDSVLELICTEELFAAFDGTEGKLTKYRASLVSENALSFVVDQLKLHEYLLRGKGERKKAPTSAEKCDLYEAIIGALYLDGGYEVAKKFFDKTHGELISKLKTEGYTDNAKNALQEMLPKERITYSTTKHGEDHNPVYKSTVIINGVNMGYGEGTNKRTAEQKAAQNTINMIKKA